MYRYFVTRNGIEREVTVSEFCYAEMEAGFRGPGHHESPMSPATSSFHSARHPSKPDEVIISGRTQFVPS